MASKKVVPEGTKVQYKITPIVRFMLSRVTENESIVAEEEIATVAHIDDARQLARSITDYERRNPETAECFVTNFSDVEVH